MMSQPYAIRQNEATDALSFTDPVQSRPVESDQLINQAVALGKQGQLIESEELLRRAIEFDPESYLGFFNLGVALQMQERIKPAIEAFKRAISIKPDSVNAHQTLAQVYQKLNQLTEAIESCRRGLAIDPNDAETHGILARLLILSGDYKRGWAEYEWRWKCASFIEPNRTFSQPRWTGAKPDGKTILLHHEQGFGDTFQFVRYARLLAERGAEVVLQCPREVFGLMRRMTDLDDVIMGHPNRPYDWHAPLMSLPMLFNTTLKTVPASIPYISPDPIFVKSWKERVAGDGAKLRVGLAWAGRPEHKQDKERSITLAQLAPLAQVDGVVFYSLQKSDPNHQAKNPPAGMKIMDTGTKLSDFSDSAGLIANLDLVICVDTAVAHLAAAMGKPVWMLLSFAPDFRWLLDRQDTPWYPTMRLLRQQSRGNWEGPIRTAIESLARLVQ